MSTTQPNDTSATEAQEPVATGGGSERSSVRPALSSVIRALRRGNLEGSVFGQSIAIRLGLSDSDVEALQTLLDTGAATAGRLGELMGLTTGAVTRLIDRLEQAGYVRRVTDPADRRRVIVEVVPEKVAAFESMLSNLGVAGSAEIARYTDAQLELIYDFLTRMAEVTRTEASRLRTSTEPTGDATGPAQRAAPLGGLSSGRLLFRSGISDVVLHGASGLTDLYRARFEGPIPRVAVRGGDISIKYPGGLRFDWRRRSADIGLNASIPWTIEIQGGASNLNGQLQDLDLRALDIYGGASKLDLTLGPPRGTVPLRVTGGLSTLRIRRPGGIRVRVKVTGGFSSLELDGARIGGKGGVFEMEAPGTGNASDHYLLEVTGGASKIRVEKS